MLLGSVLAAAADALAPMWMDDAALARRSLRRSADEREAAAALARGGSSSVTSQAARAPSPVRALAEAIEDGQQRASSRVGGTGRVGSSLSASFSFSRAVEDPTGTRARYDPLSALSEVEAPAKGPPPRADFVRGLLRAISESSSASSSSSPSPSGRKEGRTRTLGVLLDDPAPGPARFDFLRQLVRSAAEVAEQRRAEAEERRRLRSLSASSQSSSSSPSQGGRRRNKYDPIQYELDPERKPDFFD